MLGKDLYRHSDPHHDLGLQAFVQRLRSSGERDTLVQETLDHLQKTLQVDRVVLYYLYPQWKGQVTFESLSEPQLSIYGSTGADECFNQEYAELYLAGRTREISDIEAEPIHPCHKDFLRSIQVRANLVVPVILPPKKLWGLLIAHHCYNTRSWSSSDITVMKNAAEVLATSPTILEINLD